jgi:hypothetical protein
MNKATNTKRRRLIGILLAAAALVPATAQAGPDFPDGRVSLNRAAAQIGSDYPDGRVSLLATSTRTKGSVAPAARPLGDAASGLWPDEPIASSPTIVVSESSFDWGDAVIGAGSTLGFLGLLIASTFVMRRRLRLSA